MISVSKRYITSTESRKEKVGEGPRIRHPRKDITLSSNQPPLPAQRTTSECSGPHLLCLLGSTQTRENLDVPHWGSYNPYEGRALEWRLRMYGMYHHLTWTYSPTPPSLQQRA